MAATTNGNGNLVDEFEEAFQSCLGVLTKEDALSTMEKDEIRVEVDQNIHRFIDLARQMEAYFLQKRFLLSALKPELIVKEDIIDLKQELFRKEELIKRHHEKIAMWQSMLGSAPMVANGAPTPPQPAPPVQMHLHQQMHMQQMHMQQQQQQMQPTMGCGGGMNPAAAQMMMGGGMGLHGPLAYLEKTTSNIGVGGGAGGGGDGGRR